MLGHSTRPLNDLVPHHATLGQGGLERGQRTKVTVTQTWAPVPPDLQWQQGWNIVPGVVEGYDTPEIDGQSPSQGSI